MVNLRKIPCRFVGGSLTMVAALAVLPFAAADTPATITLDVKGVEVGHKETMTNRSDFGGYATNDDQSRAIEIKLQAIGVDQSRPVNVQIWWIGEAFGSTKLVLLHKETVTKNVSNRTPQVWQSESGAVKSHDMNLRRLRVRKQSGTRIAGWLVEADGDGIHSVMASEANIRDLAGSETLKAMEQAPEQK
jgi:hypothetical protein